MRSPEGSIAIRRNGEWNRPEGRRDQVTCSASSRARWRCRRACNWTRLRGAAPAANRPTQPRPRTADAGSVGCQRTGNRCRQAPLEMRRKEIGRHRHFPSTGPTIRAIRGKKCSPAKNPRWGPSPAKFPTISSLPNSASLNKCLDVLDSGDLWSKHPSFHQTAGRRAARGVGERLKRQVSSRRIRSSGRFTIWSSREVAVTGSDLFFNEGKRPDAALPVQAAAVFKARMDGFLLSPNRADAKTRAKQGKSGGVDYVHLTKPIVRSTSTRRIPKPTCTFAAIRSPRSSALLASIRGKGREGRSVRRPRRLE